MALFSKAPELSGLCDDAKWEFGNVSPVPGVSRIAFAIYTFLTD
ncbi:MAG: hypothetical protein Q3977_02645 [Oscillospiraceae bacterium]|nr:hypothetical protein [Oscillospiraceae bacterium]